MAVPSEALGVARSSRKEALGGKPSAGRGHESDTWGVTALGLGVQFPSCGNTRVLILIELV